MPSSSKLPVERPLGRPATRKKGRGNFTAIACLNRFYCVTILQNLQGCPHPPSFLLNAPLVGWLPGGKAEVTSQPLACLPGVYCVTILQNLQGCPHPPSSRLNVPRVGQLHGGKAEVISQLLPVWLDFTVLQSCRISRVTFILQAPSQIPL